MPLTVPQVVEKLLDTVNAGKVITEVGAGLALSVPTLMMLSLAGNVSVLPADMGKELKAARAEAVRILDEERNELGPVLAQVTDPKSVGTLKGDALESYARREIAARAAELEVIDAQINALLKSAGAPQSAQIQELMKQKIPLATRIDRLSAQRDSIEAARERLRTAENRLEDARAFGNNIEVFSNNITATIAFSVILGMVLGQVSRLLFVNLLYDRFVQRSPVSPAEAVRNGWATQQAFDDLIRGYYRFAEGSINMVAPALMFGIVFPLYAQRRLPDVEPWYLLATSVLSIGSAMALVVTGFFTYKEYRRRVNDLCRPDPAMAVPQT